MLEVPSNWSTDSILKYSQVKLSWLHRIKFELFEASRLVKSLKADVILSLQNIVILNKRTPQVVYVHQSLPYINKRFSYFKKTERFLAIYADIFRLLIGLSVQKANSVVVQTTWFKKAIIDRHHIPEDKITVIPPSIDIEIPGNTIEIIPNSFFYPVTPYVYKNIEVIIKAVSLLKSRGVSSRIILTLTGYENDYIKDLVSLISKLDLKENFVFCGRISREEVFNYYRSSTLLFPSKLESFGLPLLEAKLVSSYIIASDTPFANEILDGYQFVDFFHVDDSEGLSKLMENIIKKKEIQEKKVSCDDIQLKTEVRWNELVALTMSSVL
jgi:glycosyltransferase involved in cell wall biosynthesis